MAAFYQKAYKQAGPTTDLPTDDQLQEMIVNDFHGPVTDFARVVTAFGRLGLKPGSRVLDFGSNWGYAAYQFRKAGYDVSAFEISAPRAEYGLKLGLTIHTTLDHAGGDFDAIYSSHVLEHVPNPLETLRDQLARVRPGGFVIAHTPNGSAARQKTGFTDFHVNWGQVHPVLLSDAFIQANFADHPFFITSSTDSAGLLDWNRTSRVVQDTSSNDIFFVIVK